MNRWPRFERDYERTGTPAEAYPVDSVVALGVSLPPYAHEATTRGASEIHAHNGKAIDGRLRKNFSALEIDKAMPGRFGGYAT